jgi:hypothetical protein
MWVKPRLRCFNMCYPELSVALDGGNIKELETMWEEAPVASL